MSRREKKETPKGGANWMDTYGDLVTLLLTFFVMLFASSTISESKWIQIVESFTGAPPGNIISAIDPLNPTQGFSESDAVPGKNKDYDKETEDQTPGQNQAQAEIEMQFNELFEHLNSYVQENGLQDGIELTKSNEFIYITVIEGVLFDSGESNIRDDGARMVLVDIGTMLKQYENSVAWITVKGHTDNVPIAKSNPRFKDNFELSAERALSVVRFMGETSQIAMDKFIASARGEWEPVASNDSEEGKLQNRRVTFEIESKNAQSSVGEGTGYNVVKQ